ncbi:hypothetical protein F5Y15DRAFT_375207 [Xylariaceae sp. FL0016]|nr:hypothetical protein F5Y15DRAFT_375207 [Xylariaceae sp. FL0016]
MIPGKCALSRYTLNTTSSQEIQDIQDGQDQGKYVSLGAGLGIPLGVLVVAALFWALWERQQWQRSQSSEQPSAPRLNESTPKPPQEMDTQSRSHELE